jgi:hypothetical protein
MLTKDQVLAAFIGLTAFLSVLLSISHLIGDRAAISAVSLMLLFPTASFVGVVSAVGLWTLKRWGWWLAAWYLVFELLAWVPSIIYLHTLAFGAVEYIRLSLELAALTYLFTASTRQAYGVSGSSLTVVTKVVVTALLCVALRFGSLVYFAVQTMT